MSANTATRRPSGTGSTRSGSNGKTRAPKRPSLAEQRRRRERRMRRIRRTLVIVLAVALVAAAGWLVGFSSVLATEQVTVSGTKLLRVDEVLARAAVPIGRPLARQDTGAISARVAGLAQVDTVTVDRRWPNTVVVTVVERKALVAVKTAGGYVLVDHTGVAFETVPLLPAGVVEAGIDAGNAALLAEAGTVVSAMPSALRDKVATLTAARPDAFRVRLDSGLVITWGNSDDSALKGQISLLLLKQKPKAIDVSAPHSPAVR